MLYVYESTCDSLNLRLLCDQQQWEWLGGLTPPTHRIRSRKFRNLDLFDRHEIRDAELEALQVRHAKRRKNGNSVPPPVLFFRERPGPACVSVLLSLCQTTTPAQMLHSLRRDFFELQVNSEWQMIEEQAAVQQQRQREKQGNRAAAATKGDRVERVISASEDINEFLALVREDESAASDASDVLFDDDALQQQQMNKLQKQLAQTQSAAGHSLAGGRMSGKSQGTFLADRPLRPRQRAAVEMKARARQPFQSASGSVRGNASVCRHRQGWPTGSSRRRRSRQHSEWIHFSRLRSWRRRDRRRDSVCQRRATAASFAEGTGRAGTLRGAGFRRSPSRLAVKGRKTPSKARAQEAKEGAEESQERNAHATATAATTKLSRRPLWRECRQSLSSANPSLRPQFCAVCTALLFSARGKRGTNAPRKRRAQLGRFGRRRLLKNAALHRC